MERDEMKKNTSIILVAILLQAASSIRVEKVVVPPVVLAGRRVILECQYREEGDKLYSLKWWRGDDQFYQYVPPARNHFPVTGVVVNWTATSHLNSGSNGQESVVLERVGLDTAGIYKCEVMADTSFQTEYREANMTVIYAPEGPPSIYASPGTNLHNISVGQRVALTCTAPPASPPPTLTWFINGRRVDSSLVTSASPVFQRHLARVTSQLTFTFQRPQVTSGALSVTCVASQGGVAPSPVPLREMNTSGYRQSATLHLKPSPPPSFWDRIFSGSSSTLQNHSLLLPLLLLLSLHHTA